MNRITRISLLALVGTLLLSLSSARAQTYLINMGANIGVVNGQTWNLLANSDSSYNALPVNSSTPQTLLDSTGASSSVTMGVVSNASGFAWGYYNAQSSSTAVGNWPGAAVQNYLLSGGTGGLEFQLSGLNPNDTYNISFLTEAEAGVTFYTSGGSDVSYEPQRDLTLSATGANSGSGPATALSFDSTTDGPNGGPLAGVGVVSGITPDSSGNIYLMFTQTSNYAYLNTIEIDTITAPEPSTVALTLVGALGLFVVMLRRRQRAQI